MKTHLVLAPTLFITGFAHPDIITDKSSANQVLNRVQRGLRRPCWIGCGLDRKCFEPGTVCFTSDKQSDFDHDYEQFAEIAENDYGEDVVRKDEMMVNSQKIFKQYIVCHIQNEACRNEGKKCSCNQNLLNYFDNENYDNFAQCVKQIQSMDDESKKKIGYKFYMDVVGLGWNTLGSMVVEGGNLKSLKSKNRKSRGRLMKSGIQLPNDNVQMPSFCMEYIENTPSKSYGDFPKANNGWFKDTDSGDDDESLLDKIHDNDTASKFLGALFKVLFKMVRPKIDALDETKDADGKIVELFCHVFEIFNYVIKVDISDCETFGKKATKGNKMMGVGFDQKVTDASIYEPTTITDKPGTTEGICQPGECENDY